jgi:transcriptional regulator with XRE-family HTH domain
VVGSRQSPQVVPPESLGSLLRRKRVADDLTQAELGQRFGVRQQTIGAWERGERPQSRFIGSLAEYIGLEKQGLLSLIDGQLEPPPEVRARPDASMIRGLGSERLNEATNLIINAARDIASYQNPRNLGKVLKALREAVLDLAEGLADPEIGDSFLMDADTEALETARSNCIAAARRTRTAADALAVGIQRATTLENSRPRAQAPDLTFAYQRNIDAALFDDREVLETELSALTAMLHKYTLLSIHKHQPLK